MKIVFMGTPDFAVPCLARMLDDGYDVAGVFCQPDKPKGRGYALTPPPVKVLADSKSIPVYQPATLRDSAATQILRALNPDLIVVVAYGKILPPEILDLPKLGCVNIHASLLPKLRGAAPIQWSVINGDDATGVTAMYMAEGMDTGDVIFAEQTPVAPEETAGELFGRLSILGAECLAKALPLLQSGRATRTPQDDSLATYAPMLDKAMGELDFTKSGREIVNLVRGLNPTPCAYTTLGGKRVKVLKASVAPRELAGDKKRLILPCRDGAVELLLVQPEGKKPMDGAAYRMGIRE